MAGEEETEKMVKRDDGEGEGEGEGSVKCSNNGGVGFEGAEEKGQRGRLLGHVYG